MTYIIDIGDRCHMPYAFLFLNLYYKRVEMETINNGSTRSLQFYMITLAWIDELAYLKKELGYLSITIEDHEMNNSSAYSDQIIDLMRGNLHRFSKALKKIDSMINSQLERLSLAVDDKVTENLDALEFSQVRLENIMRDFYKAYWTFKMTFFAFVGSRNNNELPVFYRDEFGLR